MENLLTTYEDFNNSVKRYGSGNKYTVLVSDDGRILTFGDNEYG